MKVQAVLLAITVIFYTADAQMPGNGLPPYGSGIVGYPACVGYPPVGYPPMGFPINPPAYNPTMGLNTAENANSNSNTNVNSNTGAGAGRWI